MITLDPQPLLAAAKSFVGLSDPNGDVLPGSFAHEIRRRVGKPSPGDWDVALLYHWGYWAYFDEETGESAWPLVPTDSAHELWEYSVRHDIVRTEPAVGAIHLQFSPRRETFVRAGIVARVFGADPGGHGISIISIEGNTGRFGELGGPSIRRVRRTIAPENGDRFAHWTLLQPTKCS